MSISGGSSAQGVCTRHPANGENNPCRQDSREDGDSDSMTVGSKASIGKNGLATNKKYASRFFGRKDGKNKERRRK